MSNTLNGAGKSTFFEGTVDRVFFWISLFALGVLLFLTLWRQQQINTAQAEYELLQENHGRLMQQLEQIKSENAELRQRIQMMEERLSKRERKPRLLPPKTQPAKRLPTDSRGLFLQQSADKSR